MPPVAERTHPGVGRGEALLLFDGRFGSRRSILDFVAGWTLPVALKWSGKQRNCRSHSFAGG